MTYCSWRGRRRWGCGWSWSPTTARPPGQSTTPSGESVICFLSLHYRHCGQAGRGGRGLPAVGGRLLGQRQRLPLRSQRVQVLHHRQVRHATRGYTWLHVATRSYTWLHVCVTKKLHVAGTMTRRPTAAPAPRPTEGGGGSTGKLIWLIDIFYPPWFWIISTRNMLKKTANIYWPILHPSHPSRVSNAASRQLLLSPLRQIDRLSTDCPGYLQLHTCKEGEVGEVHYYYFLFTFPIFRSCALLQSHK